MLVESLDHLRRGGRLGRTASAVGTALGMRPVLELRGGSIDLAQVVRGRRSGLDRLLKLAYGQAVERARAGERSTVCVQYVDDRDGAQDFADLILARVAREIADSTAEGAVFADAGAPDVTTEQVAGVLMAHLGPAIVAVSVFPSIGR